ncbi:MAG: hypothetical protein R3B06_10030 [Kofleriaceae bacterium]
MPDDLRYRRSRGQGERMVDVIGPTVRQPERVAAPAPPRSPMAQGSRPDLRPPKGGETVDLGDLAAPSKAGGTLVIFGGNAVMVERQEDRIVLSMPGGVRLVGSAAEATRLAALLTRR